MTPVTATTATSGATPHQGLPAGPRPEPPSPWAASVAFGWRALLKIKHVPEMLLDVIAIPVVFTLMFTYLFGGALAGSPHRYLQFILPGTLVMAVLLVTMYAGTGLATDRATGITERFRAQPIWRLAPAAGALLGDIARYLLAAGLVILLGVAIGFRPAGGAIGVLAGISLLLVFALALSWAWTTLGLLLRTPQAVMSVRRPAATATAMAVAPAMACLRQWLPSLAAARSSITVPMTRPRAMSACAVRNVMLARCAAPLVSAGRPVRLAAMPSRNMLARPMIWCRARCCTEARLGGVSGPVMFWPALAVPAALTAACRIAGR